MLILACLLFILPACHAGEHDRAPMGGPVATADGRLMPANHTVDWIRRHGRVAVTQSNECMSCHIEEDCMSCHVEQTASPYSVHPPGFATIHASDARANIEGCTDCHQVQTFCSTCHIQVRASPIPEHSPPARFEFHPPGWLDSGHPQNHGVMARRQIDDCASCHVERDCVTCHRGINPHPPQFQFECRSWLQANPRTCTSCHVDVDALRTLCL
ncbi:MAG: hypothetical protein ACNA8W_03110 [Bradymonadaceae bacterium]